MNSANSATDFILLERIGQGDESALASLYDTYSRLVYSVSLRVLRDSAKAEDVLQDVFLKIWRRPELCAAHRESMAGWLAVVARHRSLDILRDSRIEEPIDEVHLPSLSDMAAGVEIALLIREVRRVMQLMTIEQRDALDMAFFRGLTHSEIVTLTGLPLGTVKTRVRSALRFLSLNLNKKR